MSYAHQECVSNLMVELVKLMDLGYCGNRGSRALKIGNLGVESGVYSLFHNSDHVEPETSLQPSGYRGSEVQTL